MQKEGVKKITAFVHGEKVRKKGVQGDVAIPLRHRAREVSATAQGVREKKVTTCKYAGVWEKC